MLDFRNIRGEAQPDKRDFFEQLVCHLAALDAEGTFRRIHGPGGDGGVEALDTLADGGLVGYQAKYYPAATRFDWSKLDESVATAMQTHPRLARYVIAVPRDFTGKRHSAGGAGTGMWGQWDERVRAWQALAAADGRTIDFVPWTAFELERRLLRPAARHLLAFFFEREVFSDAWLRAKAQQTVTALQARYSPDYHVPVDSLKPFDVVLRRDNVRTALRRRFELARQALVEAAVLATELPAGAGDSPLGDATLIERFAGLDAHIDTPLDQPWPCGAWMAAYARMRASAIPRQGRLFELRGVLALPLRHAHWHSFDFASDPLFAQDWLPYLPADHTRALLFVGRAGSGKSHALAHAVQAALAEGVPAIHLLGQHILDDDPRITIMQQLGLGAMDFDAMLAALDLAAEAANTRALLVIDGINESRRLDVWPRYLALLVGQVARHARLVLVVSCREEYIDLVPAALIADRQLHMRHPDQPWHEQGKFWRIDVKGFASAEEQAGALRQFMDKNGIERPVSMLFDAELFNPLFMSSVCRSMVRAGKTRLPAGIHGARQMFDFVLATKCESLGTPYDGIVYDKLRRVLNVLAAHMVERRTDHVTREDCENILNKRFQGMPLQRGDWLAVLQNSDILRVDIDGPPLPQDSYDEPNEVVRFSFQRLQDYLMARHLLDDQADIQSAFAPAGAWAFLLAHGRSGAGAPTLRIAPQWAGPCASLWALLASERGVELADLPGFRMPGDDPFAPDHIEPTSWVFHASLREREPDAFTARTNALLEELWFDRPLKQWEIVLAFACIPGHAWNADFLDAKLAQIARDDRLHDEWSKLFGGYMFSSGGGSILHLRDQVCAMPLERADPEVLRLARVAVHWLQQIEDLYARDLADTVARHLDGQPDEDRGGDKNEDAGTPAA